MQETKDFEVLLSAITHEIRNPVTLINSYLQLMSQKYPEICTFTYWDMVQAEMTHLRELLADISSWQTVHLHRVSTDMNVYLRSCADALAPFFLRMPDVAFTCRFDPSLPQMMIDPGKIRQVLDNLVRNSLEAIAPAAGDPDRAPHYICLGARRENGFLCIFVRDNGCGIPEGESAALFEPFVTRKPHGTGLGLPICARIAQAHGGALICSSEREPTEFQLLLPEESPQ